MKQNTLVIDTWCRVVRIGGYMTTFRARTLDL